MHCECTTLHSHKISTKCDVVVAQLAERSLPIPEVQDSNPVISNKFLMNKFNEQIKEKVTGNGKLK